jgi:hypothetical protein
MFNRVHGGANGSFWGAFSNFFLGATVMELLIALFKQGKPRLTQTMEMGLEKFSGKELDINELLAEKERLDELIAEIVSKQEEGSKG